MFVRKFSEVILIKRKQEWENLLRMMLRSSLLFSILNNKKSNCSFLKLIFIKELLISFFDKPFIRANLSGRFLFFVKESFSVNFFFF